LYTESPHVLHPLYILVKIATGDTDIHLWIFQPNAQAALLPLWHFRTGRISSSSPAKGLTAENNLHSQLSLESNPGRRKTQ
jgi:hypothetical protein